MKLNLAIVQIVSAGALFYLMLFAVTSAVYGMNKLITCEMRIQSILIAGGYIVPGILYAQSAARRMKRLESIEEEFEKIKRFLVHRKAEIIMALTSLAVLISIYHNVAVETSPFSLTYLMYLPFFLSKTMIDPIVYSSYFSAFSFGSWFTIIPWITELGCIYLLSSMILRMRK